MTWRRRIELRVEAGLRGVAAGNHVWDVSHWDSGTWSGLEPDFQLIPGGAVESVAISRGRDKAYNRVSTGTAELTLVWEDVADRWSMRASSPIALGQELRIVARVLERPAGPDLGAPATPYFPLYRGAVRSIADKWDPDSGEFRLTCRLVDRLADLASVNLPERPVEGLGDTTDQRLIRILAMADVDESYASLDAATVQHGSSNFARNLLDEAQATVESDAGSAFYVNRDGLIRLVRPLSWAAGSGVARAENVQMIWTNIDGGTEPVGPTDFGTGQDLDDVRNWISASRSGGTAYQTSDTDSVLTYGKRTNQRFDLTCRYDADAAAWADFWLSELAEKTERIDEVTGEVDPDADVARIADLVDIELMDKQRIEWKDGVGGMAGPFHVQGVKHRITARSWRTTVNLWAYAGEGFLPVATGGLWGSAIWQVSTWST